MGATVNRGQCIASILVAAIALSSALAQAQSTSQNAAPAYPTEKQRQEWTKDDAYLQWLGKQNGMLIACGSRIVGQIGKEAELAALLKRERENQTTISEFIDEYVAKYYKFEPEETELVLVVWTGWQRS